MIILLATLSRAEPVCQDPPTAASDMPDIEDCLGLVHLVQSISRFQHDDPILWSPRPGAGMRGRTLPYSFTDFLTASNCQFTVDTMNDE